MHATRSTAAAVFNLGDDGWDDVPCLGKYVGGTCQGAAEDEHGVVELRRPRLGVQNHLS